MATPQLANLIDGGDPWRVWDESASLLSSVQPATDVAQARAAFHHVLDLFAGRVPGFRPCNVRYHDLQHTTDTLLAFVRLVHGAAAENHPFTHHHLLVGTVAALLHDTGYIQSEDDTTGTGAKYTATHVHRSIDYTRRYLLNNGFTAEDVAFGESLLRCTGLNATIKAIHFPDDEAAMLGRMLGTADLLGQMADRHYLEKLTYLYHEFREGGIPGYENELALLDKTLNFYAFTQQRFATELGGVNHFMRGHFRARWQIDHDLYAESIQKQMEYLRHVLVHHRHDYRDQLRRRHEHHRSA
jgi:hypothetical protein